MIENALPALAVAGLCLILHALGRYPAADRIFRLLPQPLWCYLLPMFAVQVGLLPVGDRSYGWLAQQTLPVALLILLSGLELGLVLRSTRRALAATLVGALGIIIGTIVGVRLFSAQLGAEAWKGAGILSATWTGGTMNLLAVRLILQPPEAVFAPLILVDALFAYTWMALLVALSAHQKRMNAFLGTAAADGSAADEADRADGPAAFLSESRLSDQPPKRADIQIILIVLFVAVLLSRACAAVAALLPRTEWMSSTSAWTVFLVSGLGLLLAALSPIRRFSTQAQSVGSVALLIVLGATGAQGSFSALAQAPYWIAVGAVALLVHAACLLMIGRARRMPIGLLATASQANVGGVVSAPLVGAIFHPSLAATGLLLALGCNAVGTYVGLIAARLCRAFVG